VEGAAMITTTSITALDDQLNAQIEAANTAAINCTALASADATGWAGFYGGWAAVHYQWTAVKSSLWGGYNLGGALVAQYFAEDIYNNMLTFQQQLPIWQGKIHAACPSFAVPPAVLVQPPPTDRTGELIDKATHAVEIVGGIGIAAVIAVGVFKIINFVRD
jgi:hypothetical protein